MQVYFIYSFICNLLLITTISPFSLAQKINHNKDLSKDTNLRAAVHALVNCSSKTSFSSTKNILKTLTPLLSADGKSLESKSYPVFDDWGVHISTQDFSKEDFEIENGAKSVTLSFDGEPVYKVTPILDDIEIEVPATLSVVDVAPSKIKDIRFYNKDDHMEVVSRVVAYNWVFHGSSYGIPFHVIGFGHNSNYDINQLKQINFESANMECLQWNERAVSWEKASGYCHLTKSNETWSECLCYDVREMSKKAIAVGLVGIPKKEEEKAEVSSSKAKVEEENKKETKDTNMSPYAEMLKDPRASSTSDEEMEQPVKSVNLNSQPEENLPSSNKDKGRTAALSEFNGKLHRNFDSNEQIPLFTKINQFMTESIRESTQLIADIRNLETKTYTYLLEEHTDVYGVKIAGSAFNHLVSPKGVRFPMGAERDAGIVMSRQFLHNFMFTKTLEIGVAVTDRDATTFTESLDEHLSLASDIVTIAINAPEDHDFSVSDFERHVTILIPMTKGQKVSDPRCFRLDANNVLEESGCTVEKFEPSKFVECKCSSQFTRSFMIIDVAPDRDQDVYQKQGKMELYASVAKTENPDTAAYSFERQVVESVDDLDFSTNAEGTNLLVVFLVLISFVSFVSCGYRLCNSPVDASKKSKIGISCHAIVCNLGAFGSLCLALVIDDSIVKTLCLSVAIGCLVGSGLCVWSMFIHDRIKEFVIIQCRHVSMLYMTTFSVSIVCFLLTEFTDWSIVGFGCLISALMFILTVIIFVIEQWPKPTSKNLSESDETAIDARIKQLERDFSVHEATEGKDNLDLDSSDITSVSRTLSDEQNGDGCISINDLKRALVFMLAVYGMLCGALVLLFLRGPASFEILVFISSCALILSATALAYIVCVNRVANGSSKPRIHFSKRLRTESEKPICNKQIIGKRKHHASSSHQSDSDVECGMEADEATFDNPPHDDDDQEA